MHLPELISDLAVILLTGGIVTVIFKKLNQPLVLGYILAGFLIGPYMPFFFNVTDSASISTWSEIGIIILMFGLGLEFNLHKLVSVGGTAIITALTEVGGMLLFGYLVGQALGWGTMDSVFLGGMLSMSSTTIIIKAFDDLGVQKERFAQLVFGTLVIEDIAGIFMMIILSTISVGQGISGMALALKLGMLVLYLALWLILGIYLLPTLLNKASPLMSDETLLVVSLGLCFGMVLLADALGFSSALGAFLAGSLLAGTVHAERVEHLTQGVKDLFGAVFFISVGMMLDPAMVVKYIVPILVLTLVTIVGKLFFSYNFMIYLSIIIAIAMAWMLNRSRVGLNLRSVGEDPATADAAGINVIRYKYLFTCIGGGICGLGGLYFTMVSGSGNWAADAMDGKGWLAVALVIFALWRPLRAIWGSILFGGLMIMYMRVTVFPIPTEIYKILPYVVTLIVLVVLSIRQRRENQPPASLGNAYFREER